MVASFLHLSWGDVERLAHLLAEQARDYKAEAIVGISRGGFIPAVLVADELQVGEVYSTSIKHYTGVGKTLAAPDVRQVPEPARLRGRRVLIVDDLVDSGKTMQSCYDKVIESGASEVRTASLLHKSLAKPPYYCALTTKPEEWVVFPWERSESTQWIKEQKTQI